jgi:hypothetical protein
MLLGVATVSEYPAKLNSPELVVIQSVDVAAEPRVIPPDATLHCVPTFAVPLQVPPLKTSGVPDEPDIAAVITMPLFSCSVSAMCWTNMVIADIVRVPANMALPVNETVALPPPLKFIVPGKVEPLDVIVQVPVLVIIIPPVVAVR